MMGTTSGVRWMLLATFLFTSLDATAKWLSQTYPVEQVVWARFFFHVLVLGVWLGPRIMAHLRTQRLWLQLFRSSLMLTTNFLFFVAVQSLPLADVLAVMFVGPLLVTALSVPLLGERVGPARAPRNPWRCCPSSPRSPMRSIRLPRVSYATPIRL